MKYFNRKYFVDDFSNSLEHRAKNGTANSTSNERGTDGKKNNTSEYNHKYYTNNKAKWKNKNSGKKSSNDSLFYDKDGKARFGHKLFDPNDPDFKRTDGETIPGTNLRMFTNANGSVIVLGDGVKFSYPPGTKITSDMKNAMADVEKKKGSLNDEQYVAKMHNAVTKFADNQGLDTDIAGTEKAKKGPSSKKKDTSDSKKEKEEKKESKEKTEKKDSSSRKNNTKEKESSESTTSKSSKELDALAADVVKGKYKSGEERKKLLGDDYEAIQKRVNEIMKRYGSKKK